MRLAKTRVADSTFDINLAPFLDIIVAVVPLLLLSVVFVEIKMIETPVPQVVQQIMERDQKDPDPEVQLNLRVSKEKGFAIEIQSRGGKSETIAVPLKGGALDYEGLSASVLQTKNRFPAVFKMGLAPEGDIPFTDLVRSMDVLRKTPSPQQKIAFTDATSGQKVETDLMFPNVTFSNVVGE